MSAQQLAEALWWLLSEPDRTPESRPERYQKAREALAAFEAAPQQEPAITVTIDEFDLVQDWAESRLPPGTHKLYAAPQQEPVAEVYRAHPGGRSRNIGLNDVRPLRGATLPPPGTKLYAAPQQAQAPGWQPIATAPENTEREVVVQWIDSDGALCRDLDYREDGCWMGWHNHAEHVEVIGGHGVSYTPPYTEWMPIPAPQQGSNT